MFRRFLGFFVAVLMAGGVAFYYSYYAPVRPVVEPIAIPDSVGFEPVPEPRLVYGMILQDNHEVIENTIKRNERLGDILMEYNVPATLINQLSNVSRKIFDPRKIAANEKYTVIVRRDSVVQAKALVYEPNPIEYVVFKFGDSLSVDLFKREVTTVERAVSGVIQSSLSDAIVDLGISNELTNRFVDIFGWQVDFQRLQKGDKFKLIFEENMVEGQPIGIGEILGIYFEHYGNEYYAFPFDQGDGTDFFDEEGKSLRKALLKYPIEFTRISSRYNLRRFHPVQKRYKAHLGTDFAAPVGTPIRSVGDGIVVEARYKSNNGNYVKIKHNGTYTTQYLHMSRIASGIKPGVRVRQSQTIGYVGSTGLATGPHLCYRFWKNGRQVDALRVELPPSEPVADDRMEMFQSIVEQVTEKLNAIPYPAETVESLASLP